MGVTLGRDKTQRNLKNFPLGHQKIFAMSDFLAQNRKKKSGTPIRLCNLRFFDKKFKKYLG